MSTVLHLHANARDGIEFGADRTGPNEPGTPTVSIQTESDRVVLFIWGPPLAVSLALTQAIEALTTLRDDVIARDPDAATVATTTA